MQERVKVALDNADCIKAQANIGETVYHNICEGTTRAVEWGSADWFAAAAVVGVCVLAGAMMLALLWLVVAVMRDPLW